ncbi:NAD(P)-dependent dehydrogenase, short-chain alcohol dehydrogenase family [Actinopolymorpha cephalotaxi]|uniref:NAD(P)-dependent dehydrogenase (Short-subunit alcohol dehydrogenase family) n=1 Tax=Actinopolymorpha cephalotaxi TaxID=504797 RepID=A0A1I2TE17_9ACTN|nr:oxidoreductase [Actinopolymorpha cephalotaxi]NYH83043.1 NAD(P)-dependent dehydrogenase (short-subunit alcohol dehydrogenase family) [Actinopolymorpha cephalotaxi]SFG63035.1 NAD(P)-dependent dehydrogenase, short-chain alcohol dehydrogenase family [Actinopolymorpha cephalotaxi]
MGSPSWTADQIPDLTGRTAVVTGANAGLGYHVALELARYGAAVVLACRDLRRGEAALARIRRELARPAVELRPLDLGDLSSVRGFAADVTAEHPSLDLLVNNAGIMALPRALTVDGFERQLGVNHLGHFALTGLLLPALLAAPEPRVVTVSSQMHAMGTIDFDDLMSERRYGPWKAYGQSKLANLLFTFELQRRADRAGMPLTSVATHPGYAATNLQNAAAQTRRRAWVRHASAAVTRLVAQPAAQGALTTLYAATMPDVRGGEFFGPDSFGGSRGHPTRVKATAKAYDPETAARLWERSEQLTGVAVEGLDSSP